MTELIPSFMENKAPEIDEAWAWNRKLVKVHEASTATIARTKRFKQSVQECILKSRDSEIKKVGLDINCTWDDVQEEVAKAIEEYHEKGQNWKRSALRTAGRSFGGAVSAVGFLLELLPQGEYTSVLCGALKLVYNAARRLKEMRELVVKSFEGLSQAVDDTRSYIQLYRQDVEVQAKAEELYIAIIEAVENILTWVNHNPFTEGIKAIFQHRSYGLPLQEKISANIQEKVILFKNRIDICLHARILNIDNNIVQLNADSQKAFSTLFNLLKGLAKDCKWALEEQREHNLLIDQRSRRWDEGMLRIKSQTPLPDNTVKGITYPISTPAANPMTVFTPPIAPIPVPIPPAVPMLVPPTPIPMLIPPAPPAPMMTTYQLLQMLENTHRNPSPTPIQQITNRDISLSIALGASLPLARQARTASVLRHPQFQDWFQASHSGTMIINGMEFGSSPDTSISPLSYLCALLYQTVSVPRIALPLAFYCAQHATPGDALEGAEGLLRSLCAQVLFYGAGTIDLSYVSGSTNLEAVMANDVYSLCFLLEKLLQAIASRNNRPPLVVFCLIDGISYFETQQGWAPLAL